MDACFSSSSSITTGIGPPSIAFPSRLKSVFLAADGVALDVGARERLRVVRFFQKVGGDLMVVCGGHTSSSTSSPSSSLTTPAGIA